MSSGGPELRARLRRIARLLGLLLVAILVIMVLRAETVTSRQPVVVPRAPVAVDGEAVAAKLATLVKRKTVSVALGSPAPPAELDALHADLAAAFPKVTAALTREVIGDHSLLYTWKGTDAATKPIILCAHMDVVPVEPGTESAWTHPAFDGVVEGGFVWGRGTIDDKGSLVAILAAVEMLLGEGFAPARTVYLAFGQDEEISGLHGAARIVDALASRGVHAELALDEGSALVEGVVTDVPAPVAAIGIAEKGYLSLDLKVAIPGGHSSTPAPENALTVLARAIERLQANPMPARIDGATEQFFAWAAPEMRFGPRLALANTWVTAPLVRRMLAKSPTLGAAIRTTTAVTVFHAGVKDNVVPAMAAATVNFRVLPGDTTDDVIEHARRVLDDARVVIEPQAGSRTEPSKVSRVDTPAFRLMAETVREVFPGTVVAPSLVLGATDGRYYGKVADDVYRFAPFRLTAADIQRIHGKDERLSVASLADGVRFYRRLVTRAAGP
jgi:carboxypeptidase PM20D1